MHPNRDPKTIGASDVVAIVGLSEYSTAFDIALRITGRVGWEHSTSSKAARWGIRLEDDILDDFEEENGILLPVRGQTFYHPEIEWAAATPDGINHEHPACVDAKNMDYSKSKRFADGLPEDFTVQGTWQAGIYNRWAAKYDFPLLTCSVFHVAIGNRPPKPYVVNYDGALFEKLMVLVTNFRNKALADDFDFPAPVQQTERKIAEIGQATSRQGQWMKKYVSLGERIDALKAEQAEVSTKIKLAIGDRGGITNGVYRAAVTDRSGSTSYAEVVKTLAAEFRIPLDVVERVKAKHQGKSTKVLRIYSTEKEDE